MTSKYDILIGAPILGALLACGGSSEKVIEVPAQERTVVMVPAAGTAPAQPQKQKDVEKTKKKRVTHPDGTTVETETKKEIDDE